MPPSQQLLEAKGIDALSSILIDRNNFKTFERLSEDKRKMTFLLVPCFMLYMATSCFTYFFNKFIYLSFYFWLRWVFVAAHGLSLVVAASLDAEHGL